MFDFRAERVTRSVYESLERLGLDHIDVIQVGDVMDVSLGFFMKLWGGIRVLRRWSTCVTWATSGA